MTSDGSFDTNSEVPAVCSACIQALTKSANFEVVGFAAIKVTALDVLQAECEGILFGQRLSLESISISDLDAVLRIQPLF